MRTKKKSVRRFLFFWKKSDYLFVYIDDNDQFFHIEFMIAFKLFFTQWLQQYGYDLQWILYSVFFFVFVQSLCRRFSIKCQLCGQLGKSKENVFCIQTTTKKNPSAFFSLSCNDNFISECFSHVHESNLLFVFC